MNMRGPFNLDDYLFKASSFSNFWHEHIFFFLDKRNSKKCQTIRKRQYIFFRCECVLISDPSPQTFPTRLLLRVAITDILTFFIQFTHSMTEWASSQPLTYWIYPMTPSVRLLVGPFLCSAFCLSVCQGREDALRPPIRQIVSFKPFLQILKEQLN